MNTLSFVNFLVCIIFFICYANQFLYIPIQWFFEKRYDRKHADVKIKDQSYCFMICARNEEVVIADLIDSIRNQDYDRGPVTIFVMADNCTDRTAEIAREHGAIVYERNNLENIGKGYALEELRRHIREDYPDGFDCYAVFDADNVLSPTWLTEMNKTMSEGYDAATSYRNSKNYGDNWISSSNGLWFLRESIYLNGPRRIIGSCCMVSGTGYVISRKISDEIGDWPFHLLTEDIEFSAYMITRRGRIGYAKNAEFYDEQPRKFTSSFRQRIRWGKGYLQVFRKYGWEIIKGIFKGNFACFDMTMSVMPSYFLSIVSIALNIGLAIWGTIIGDDIMIGVRSIGQMLIQMYATVFVVALITVITAWKHLRTTTWKKIKSILTCPIFMATYVAVAVVVFFAKANWKPIPHNVSMREMKEKGEDPLKLEEEAKSRKKQKEGVGA